MTEPHVMTGPEHYLVTPAGFQRDMRCDDCRNGKLGDRFKLAIEDGAGVVACTVCDGLPDLLVQTDAARFEMAPIPVSVSWEDECQRPDGHCGHWSGVVITPRTGASCDKGTNDAC